MNINTLKKVYSEENCIDFKSLKIDGEGMWSITHPNDADLVSEEIKKMVGTKVHIVDMNSGCGGNLFSFAKYFDKVTGIELVLNRFLILKNNINCYNYANITIVHDNCINHINLNYDVYFFDPPWGGPEYKKHKNVKIYLSDILIENIISKILNKLIVIKLPFNYQNNFQNIKKKIVLNNIIIVFIINN
uniref:RNA cap guanine-N2 methyltransferase n=1 Tax=Megaviridae environmental sample TaxID=1737588 RepID=A0A5J6VKP6_9VIRU|nr:MAG: RNA cap guanine-N2 methyltransferase [Megaviridae environmental sample]